MKIFIASDHAGFRLKSMLTEWLVVSGHEIKDFGPYDYNSKDDYPDFIRPMAEGLSEELSKDPEVKGIILGYSGQGEAQVANRVKGIRATVLYSPNDEIVKLSREHNNSNILSLGASFFDEENAKQAIDLWLKTDFDSSGENARHLRRIQKIDG